MSDFPPLPPLLARFGDYLLDEGNAVLLQSGVEPGSAGAPGFWILPGGGAAPGGSQEAARRSRSAGLRQ